MTKSEIFEQITNSPEYQVLKDYHQHGSHSVYNHSVNVYNACFKIAKKLHIKVNEESLAKSALLHDYFLYDWHDDKNPVSHFTRHPARAAKNAKRDFGLTKKEERAIRSHMFPAGLRPPTSREALILTFADKYCATRELLFSGRRK